MFWRTLPKSIHWNGLESWFKKKKLPKRTGGMKKFIE